MQQWNWKGIDVVTAQVRRQDEKVEAMRQGRQLLRDGQITTQSLVTVYDFKEIEQAFRDLDGRKPGLYKAVLKIEP